MQIHGGDEFEKTIFAGENGGENDSGSPVELPDDIPVEKISGYGDLRVIGVGGMGTVFEGEDKLLLRKVALKVMRPKMRSNQTAVDKFINEARLTAGVEHPSVVPVHRLGIMEDGGVYFSMKLIRGETLRSILEKLASGDAAMQKKYTLRRLLEIFIAGCNGVAAAHDRGILHCDLKPSNLMVGNFGEVLVLDWGVARECEPPGPVRPGVCGEKRIEGTPVFMAPELIAGELEHPDVQTDVYSLGTILYSILTWSIAPFDVNMEQEELLKLVAAGKFIPLRSRVPKKRAVSPELEAICMKAMHPDRMERYRDVGELLKDLHNYLDGYPVEACAPNWLYNFFKLIRRRPLIPSVVVAFLISLCVYNIFNGIRQETRINNALNIIAANQGRVETLSYKTLRNLKILQNPDINLDVRDRARLEYDILHSCVNSTVSSFLVLEAVNQLPVQLQRDFIRRDGGHMIKRLLNINLTLGNRDIALNLIKTLQTSWVSELEILKKEFPEIAEMIDGVVENRGKLEIINSGKNSWKWSFDEADIGKNRIVADVAAGDRAVTFKSVSGKKFRALFNIDPGLKHKVDLNELPEIPENFCYIPGGEFENTGNTFSLWNSRIPGFMISTTPVSAEDFGKYVDGLPENHPLKLRKSVRQDRFGNALVRYEDAVGYCRYMSDRLKCKVSVAGSAAYTKALRPDGSSGERSFYMVKICQGTPEWLDGGKMTGDTGRRKRFAAFRLCLPAKME